MNNRLDIPFSPSGQFYSSDQLLNVHTFASLRCVLDCLRETANQQPASVSAVQQRPLAASKENIKTSSGVLFEASLQYSLRIIEQCDRSEYSLRIIEQCDRSEYSLRIIEQCDMSECSPRIIDQCDRSEYCLRIIEQYDRSEYSLRIIEQCDRSEYCLRIIEQCDRSEYCLRIIEQCDKSVFSEDHRAV